MLDVSNTSYINWSVIGIAGCQYVLPATKAYWLFYAKGIFRLNKGNDWVIKEQSRSFLQFYEPQLGMTEENFVIVNILQVILRLNRLWSE